MTAADKARVKRGACRVCGCAAPITARSNGANAERQRIRRAQRDALKLLFALFPKDDEQTQIKHIYRTIDNATRATRKKGRRK